MRLQDFRTSERERDRESQTFINCILSEIQHYNFRNRIIGICFSFNYILVLVLLSNEWKSLFILIYVFVLCVLMDNTALCILKINCKLYDLPTECVLTWYNQYTKLRHV